MVQGRRTTLVILGLVLAGLALCSLALSMLFYVSSLIAFNQGTAPMAMPFFFNLTPAVNFLLAAALVVSGVLLLSAGGQLKRAGGQSTWCVMGGVGDLLLGASVLLLFLSSLLSANYTVILEVLGVDYALMDVIFSVILYPSYLLCAASGALYIVAGIAQKKAGKTNILLVISGCALCAAALLIVFIELLYTIPTLDVMYILHIFYALVLFAGRGMRGIAPLGYTRAPN